MNAPRRFVIPNPLPSTLSFRIRFSGANIRGPAHCHSESASAVPYTRPCTLSFRIRFSGEESAFPASRFQETRRAPCLATLARPALPALIETDSYQGTPSGVPPRTHPAGPRPSGATAIARSSALPLIKPCQRMAKEPLSRTPSSAVRNFGDMLTPAFRNRPETSDF